MPVVHDETRALTAALRFLLDHQSSDGAWRSSVYGTFRDGDALTPLVLHTLLAAQPQEEVHSAICRGAAYLAALIGKRPINNSHGLNYPTYTASLAVQVLSRPVCASYRDALAPWLAYLKERQVTEALGWQPSDSAYGGWSYAHELPRKPPSGHSPGLAESNISATVFAMDTLRAAGACAEDPALRQALRFVRRCQNFADDPAEHNPALDDGGFFFMSADALRNKAGEAGVDRSGRQRYRSYGSTTADGLRALLIQDRTLLNARVLAAHDWLAANFSATIHPGKFPAQRQALQASVYFYYCWSLARTLTVLGVEELPTPSGPVHWAEALAGELRRRQRPDGSWMNDAIEVREDDPIVATALAAGALILCQRR
jgi:squalene-hopene/tetraprenyl-beta-curcumene cyclase